MAAGNLIEILGIFCDFAIAYKSELTLKLIYDTVSNYYKENGIGGC